MMKHFTLFLLVALMAGCSPVEYEYVKSRTYVPKGTRLEIIAVEQCTNCYFNLEAKIKFRVAPQNLTTSYQLPVYLRDDLLVKEWGIEDKDTNYHHNLFAME